MKDKKKYILSLLILVLVVFIGCSSKMNNSSNPQSSNEYAEVQSNLYERLNGRWVSEVGDYFFIYKEDCYVIEFSLGDNQGRKTQIEFQDGMYAKENNIAIIYRGSGDCSEQFLVLLAEDGESFVYDDVVFARENDV